MSLDTADPGLELSDCFRELNPPLRRYLERNSRSYDDAEDLAQEVYLRLVRNKSRDGIRNRRAFLFKAARNLLRDRSRRVCTRLERHSISLEGLDFCDAADDPVLHCESLDMLGRLAQVLDSLKSSTRQAFLRHRVEEWPHVQIAAVMGVSVSMVEKHIRAATAALLAAGIDVNRR